eukprot:scaffold113655_cov75-Phaeocystis_antarctica.AAC.1
MMLIELEQQRGAGLHAEVRHRAHLAGLQPPLAAALATAHTLPADATRVGLQASPMVVLFVRAQHPLGLLLNGVTWNWRQRVRVASRRRSWVRMGRGIAASG